MPMIAPWLKPADPVGYFMAGNELALRMKQERDRKAQMDAISQYRLGQLNETRQRQLEQQQYNAQRLQETQEHNEATEGLRQQLNDLQSQKNALTLQIATMKDDTSQQAIQARLEAIEAKSRDVDKQLAAAEQRQQEKIDAAVEAAKTKADAGSPGKFDISVGPQGATGRITGLPLNSSLINTVLGTNAPAGTGTNYVGTLAPPPTGQRNAPSPAPLNKEQRVVGTLYQTPKGPMTWTAGGWMPAQ
jgi:hypothetical protein